MESGGPPGKQSWRRPSGAAARLAAPSPSQHTCAQPPRVASWEAAAAILVARMSGSACFCEPKTNSLSNFSRNETVPTYQLKDTLTPQTALFSLVCEGGWSSSVCIYSEMQIQDCNQNRISADLFASYCTSHPHTSHPPFQLVSSTGNVPKHTVYSFPNVLVGIL